MGGGASHPAPHGGHGPGEPLVVHQPQPSLQVTAVPPNPLIQPNNATYWTHVRHTQTITDTSGVLHVGHDNNKEVLSFARGRMPDGSIRIGARAVTSSGYRGGQASIAFNGIEVHLNDCDVLLVSPNLVMSPMVIGGPPPPNAVICGQMPNNVPLFAGTAILQAGSNADQLVVPGTVVPQGIILSFMGKQINIATGLIHVLCVQPAPNPSNWKPPSTNMQYWEQFMNMSKSMAMQQQQMKMQPMMMQQQQPMMMQQQQPMMMMGGGGGSAWPPNQLMMQQQQQQQQQQMRMQQQNNMHGMPYTGGHTLGNPGSSSVPALASGAAAGVVAGAGAAAVWGSGAVDTVGNWAPGAAGDAAAWGSSVAGDAAAWGSGAAQTVASSDAAAWGSSVAGDAAAWGSGAANNAAAWGSGAVETVGNWAPGAAGDAAAWGSGAADSVGNWGGGAVDAVAGWGGGAVESVGSWAQNIDAGSAFDGVGNAFNDVGGTFEDMGSSMGNALDDLF